jgi:CDP-diacylglycerol--serine O-phosphatidyltransferase
VLPLLIVMIATIGLLLSYPWEMLLAITAIYLASLPFGYRAWQANKARDAQAAAASAGQQA